MSFFRTVFRRKKACLAAGCAAVLCCLAAAACLLLFRAAGRRPVQPAPAAPARAAGLEVSALASAGGAHYTTIRTAAGALTEQNGIDLLPFDPALILSIGNQTAGRCSWYSLRYARTVLDGAACSGSGMWSNGAVWPAGGYTAYSGDLASCLAKIYSELTAGRPVIVHVQNTYVGGSGKYPNRTSTYEYHQTASGWSVVTYPHISTSAAYGHWVCVVGVRSGADPASLKESDLFALDPARVNAGGQLALTPLLDGTIWTANAPLKVAA